MRLQRIRPVSKSVRIPGALQPAVKRRIVRLSLNPVIYRRSQQYVRWTRSGSGTISPQSIVVKAIQCYPRFSLSNAVEAVLLDLLLEKRNTDFTADEKKELTRFEALPLSEKIRITQKRNRLARYLQALPWQQKK